MTFLRNLWTRVVLVLGLATPEYIWQWCGEPGYPRWDLFFESEGFAFKALMQPDIVRPTYLGRFVSFAGPDTVMLGQDFYIPSRQKSVVVNELIESGLTAAQAEKLWVKQVKNEAHLTDQYDRGFFKTYMVKITVRRGRSELAHTTLNGIIMDPAMLILGGEKHVTARVMDQREMLISAADWSLKEMAAPVMHFN